jgi:hypothetical protein
MPGKRHTAEERVIELREADVQLARGASLGQACCKIGMTDRGIVNIVSGQAPPAAQPAHPPNITCPISLRARPAGAK